MSSAPMDPEDEPVGGPDDPWPGGDPDGPPPTTTPGANDPLPDGESDQ